MRIINLRLKNFLSFEEEQQVNFTTLDTIVGPNDAGKTNLFRAIVFVGDIFRDIRLESRPYYHNGNVENLFEVSVKVQFDEEESEALSNFLICSNLMENVLLSGQVDANAMKNLQKEIVLNYCKDLFKPLFENTWLEVRAQGQEAYPVIINLRIGENGKELFINSMSIISKDLSFRSYSPSSFVQLILDELRHKYPELVGDYLTGKINTLSTFDYTPPDVFNLIFSKLDADASNGIIINGFTFTEFERRIGNRPELRKLRAFLTRRGFKGSGVNLFDVITTIYNSSVIRTSDIRSKPQVFLNSLEDIESLTDNFSFSNLTGEELPAILFTLKNCDNPNHRRVYSEIGRVFKDVTGLEFDVGIRTRRFSAGSQEELVQIGLDELVRRQVIRPDAHEHIRILGVRTKKKENVYNELFIRIVKGDLTFPLEFTAAGIFESLVLITALIGQRHKVILLDEPALNLHPILQRRILELIHKRISENGNQVILITHSPYLVSAEKLESIWRFTNKNGSTHVINLGKMTLDLSQEEQQKIIQQLRNSDIRSLLFSRGVILVEGPSDKIVIEKLDRHLSLNNNGANIEDNEWTIIAMGGKDNLGTFIKLTKILEVPYVAVMDYDALMCCDKSINIQNNKIKTSAIFHSLHLAGILGSSEIDLKDLEKSIIQCNGQSWYDQDCFNTLADIAKNTYNIFVFPRSLEEILQTSVERKDSKPLHALDIICEKIANNSIPKELYSVMDFIKRIALLHD